MKLKSFGCSFIYGSDLSDIATSEGRTSPSQYAWPALLAKKIGYDYECYARPGSGNLQILDRLLNQINDTNAVYVIGWTWIDRFDYIDPHGRTFSPGAKWQTLMPIVESTLAENYYKNLHSEYQDKLSSLIYINTAISALKEKKCQFIMTAMDDLLWDKKWHCTGSVFYLQNQLESYVAAFNGDNFLNWSKKNNFQISDTLHPLEDAHRAAADLIYKNLDQYIRQ